MFLKLLAVVFTLSSPAWANDGGVVGITVNDLKIGLTTFKEGEATEQPLRLDQNQEVTASFEGTSVLELMKLLPGGVSVIKDYSKHVRTLTIAATGGEVTISCADAEQKDEDYENPNWTAITPACTVSMKRFSPALGQDELEEYFGDWNDLNVPNQCVP